MSQTQVPAGSALARKVFGAALFAQTVRASGFSNKITGTAPKQSDAEAKMKGQTSPDMPIVRVTDLSKSAGETISVDMFNTVGGMPLVGDVNAENLGTALTSSSMDISINLLTKVIDAGGKMAQQRTVHQLRGLAMAQLSSYFPRLDDQLSVVHLAGARGTQVGVDWVLPLQYKATTATDPNPDFAPIAINPVRAPTFNRHFVTDGNALVAGGAQLALVDTTDVFKLEHLDELRNRLDSMEFPLQPVKIADDPAASDEPLWVMYVTNAMWNSVLTSGTAGNSWRTFLQNAWNRKSYGSKHPLFSGEAGIWNGILVRKMDRMAVQFGAGEVQKIITSANAATATETDVTVAALGANHVVHRGLLLGAQALATVYGRNQTSDYHMSWMERPYNFERNLEVAADVMGGKAKLRFQYPVADGTLMPTDHGVIVVDAVVPKPVA